MKGAKRFVFRCLRPLAPCTATEPRKCELDIDLDGHQGYSIQIDTDDGPRDGTLAPIHFTLIGDKAEGQTKIISEKGLNMGSSKSFTIFTTPIGKVIGFKLHLETKGRWKPTKISVTDLSKIIN